MALGRFNFRESLRNPAAIAPVWLEKPERIAALAMLTVVGLLVYSIYLETVASICAPMTSRYLGTKVPPRPQQRRSCWPYLLK